MDKESFLVCYSYSDARIMKSFTKSNYTKKSISFSGRGYRSPSGPSGFGLLGTEYDGTNDYITDPEFDVDSKLFSGSMWLFAPGSNPSASTIMFNGAAKLKFVTLGTGNEWHADFRDSTNTRVCRWLGTSSEVLTGDWHHFGWSIDAGSSIYQAVWDGTDLSSQYTDEADLTINLKSGVSFAATSSGSNPSNIRLSQVWMKSGINVDIVTNLNDFYGGGNPPDGGVDGSGFGHGIPEFWMQSGNGTNDGSSADFTVVGAPLEVAGPGA